MRQLTNIIMIIMMLLVAASSCSSKNTKTPKQEHSTHSTHTTAPTTDVITLTKRDEQYANIAVDTVKLKTIAEYTTLLGTSSIDEKSVTVITSRVRGRLDKLYARDPQQRVVAGQPLYAIYSEELLAYENEYLDALQQQAQFTSMQSIITGVVEGAKRKLLLWGLTPEQVYELKNAGKPLPLVTYRSPVSGTVTDLPVSEGQYVETGTPLYRVADLSTLWIETQMYTSELRWLYEKPTITVEFDAYPNRYFHAVPVFDNPVIEADQKVSLVRFLVENPDLQLKPGMMAYVNIKRNEKKTMVIPKSSILIGNMTTAWVRKSEGQYESRMIRTGIQNKKEVEVLSGLMEGEIIVTSGAYLLNSALILKKGTGMPGMEGMKM